MGGPDETEGELNAVKHNSQEYRDYPQSGRCQRIICYIRAYSRQDTCPRRRIVHIDGW